MEEKKYPLISLIILNYNQLEVTCEFLESTRSLTYPNFEIVMVDNASRKDPTEVITSRYPEVRLIVTDKNYGFTGGNNIAMRAARGDYMFVVNNDTEVGGDLLERLLEPFAQDPEVGVVSPKIYYYEEQDLIQFAGFTKVNPITGRNECIGNQEKEQGQYDVQNETYYAHGAAMLVKKEVIEKTGMFADMFFIYYEELDWSARIRNAGYKIIYQPTTSIVHKESITMGKESPLKAYYHTRNRILYMRRHSSGTEFLGFSLFLSFLVIPKSLLKYTLKGQWQHLRSFVKGIMWHFSHKKEEKGMLPDDYKINEVSAVPQIS
ncbi:MAG: glycosyltransferase family 2 protein [Cyclobacteriaceae bacterium]